MSGDQPQHAADEASAQPGGGSRAAEGSGTAFADEPEPGDTAPEAGSGSDTPGGEGGGAEEGSGSQDLRQMEPLLMDQLPPAEQMRTLDTKVRAHRAAAPHRAPLTLMRNQDQIELLSRAALGHARQSRVEREQQFERMRASLPREQRALLDEAEERMQHLRGHRRSQPG